MNPNPRVRATPTSGEWRAWVVDAHATARRLTRHLDRADDIAQEALVLLVRLHLRVRDPHRWLLVVLRRLAARAARRAWELGFGSDPVARAEALDALLDFERGLSLLPARQAELLRLAALGYSHAEIAGQIGCAVHQVGPRLQRAQRALGRRLGATPGGPPGQTP